MAWLKIVKAINHETAANIRYYKTLEETLKTLADGKFLCKDLEAAGQENQMIKGTYQVGPMVKNVGPFKNSKYELKKDRAILTYERSPNSRLMKNLEFRCEVAFWGRGVSLGITERHKGREVFGIGQFVYGTEGLDFYSGAGNIYELARYFQDKSLLYVRIRKFLINNRKNFETLLNVAFVEDLLALFSVVGREKKLPNFAIPAKNVAKSLLTRDLDEKALLLLGCSSYRPKGYPSRKGLTGEGLILGFYLNTKNQLIVTAECENRTGLKVEKAVMQEISTSEAFDKALQTILLGFLQQLAAMTSFGEALYEKVKTKILLGNI